GRVLFAKLSTEAVRLHWDGDYQGARSAYESALKVDPGRAQTTYNFARLEHEEEHLANAQELYEKALSLNTLSDTIRADALAYLGLIYQELHSDAETAGQCYSIALALDPEHHELHGDAETAGQCYSTALALDPEHPAALDFAAYLLLSQDPPDEERAASLHASVCRNDPYHADEPCPYHLLLARRLAMANRASLFEEEDGDGDDPGAYQELLARMDASLRNIEEKEIYPAGNNFTAENP
ncbi:hypothetical protein T484DRAFT_1818069, partial [Baffinella frigidus]